MIGVDMILFVGIIGLIFGSFYNVVALRLLNGTNLVHPPSHCPKCLHRLGILDLVPFFSYITSRGKCRYCKEKVSFIYPFGEMLTAISFVAIVYRIGLNPVSTIQLVFISFMIIATITDLKETIVPDVIIVVGFLSVLALRLILWENPLSYLVSGILSFLLLFVIFILSGGKMGGADVKIYALIGLSIGFMAAVQSLFYASILGLMFNGPFILLKKWDKKKEIPFLPFITIAIIITYYINAYYLIVN